MTGWPDPSCPGVPLNPEQNGAHVITNAPDYSISGPWWLLWCAPERLWTDLFGNREPPEAMAKHRYVGPAAAPQLNEPRSVVQPDAEWRPTSEAPEKPGTYVTVRWTLTNTFRWLAYKADGARQMGCKGRWQRATEHGFVNENLPAGEFRLNLPKAPVCGGETS